MVYVYYQHRGLCWLVCSIIVRLYLPSKRSLKNPLVPRIHCETSSRSAWESVKVLSRPCTVLRSGPYHNCIWREEENFFPCVHPSPCTSRKKSTKMFSYLCNNFLSFWGLLIGNCHMLYVAGFFLKIVHFFFGLNKIFRFSLLFPSSNIINIQRTAHQKLLRLVVVFFFFILKVKERFVISVG